MKREVYETKKHQDKYEAILKLEELLFQIENRVVYKLSEEGKTEKKDR